MRNKEFKINTKKRNIVIAAVAVTVVTCGVLTGCAIYKNANAESANEIAAEVENEEIVTEAIKNDEATTEEPTTEAVKETKDKTTEAAENTEATTQESTTTQKPTTEAKPTTQPTTEAAHTHNWSPATCTSPKTCKSCHETSGSTLGHDFGSNNQTCSRCGTSNPNYVEPHTHSWETKTWTETVHHPGEIVTIHVCAECGFTGSMAEVKAHQDNTGYNGELAHMGTYSNGSEERGGCDETITHHKRVCSCGEEEVID